jgi:hypothetical protein
VNVPAPITDLVNGGTGLRRIGTRVKNCERTWGSKIQRWAWATTKTHLPILISKVEVKCLAVTG